jgi:Histidine kinase-, DNA gyrase B-, and HSP90-like ATPase
MFRVSARTVLQLGSELISSDSVAFYELIKNAFDANSKRVTVRVIEFLPYSAVGTLRDALRAAQKHPAKSKLIPEAIASTSERIHRLATRNAPGVDQYLERISAARTLVELLQLLDEAGAIEFVDTGEGMSLKDLQEVYLTIGTPSKVKSRVARAASANKGRPILGEKGIGRLSAMRLGMRLRVDTTKKGEKTWNHLELDWRHFEADIDAMIESVEVDPVKGEAKDDMQEQGTRIAISALTSQWTAAKLEKTVAVELSKLMDPFSERTQFPISVYFNKTNIDILKFNHILFDHAHATIKASLSIEANDKPVLRGGVKYLLEKKEQAFVLADANLKSSAGVESLDLLVSLGPFTMEAYWYNRRILEEITGIGDREQVRELVRAWSGGLMLFRDGFRVSPYGGPNDDWLNLDRGALAAQAYKVNRAQLIGKVDITSEANPLLRGLKRENRPVSSEIVKKPD